ncbi:hypothetical protein C8R46DRAFT_1035733 [Mycena filopes]|nr:hypothetical protein C8R46DRAFT_1035733 [Mycena filopes]
MGRRQYTLVLEDQHKLYTQARQNPFGLAAQEFYGPTLDPIISHFRRRLDAHSLRPVERLPTPAPQLQLISNPLHPSIRDLSFRNFMRQNSGESLMPTAMAPASGSTPQIMVNVSTTSTISPQAPPIVPSHHAVPNLLDAVLGVPVIFADTIMTGLQVVLRFAILGPNIPGMIYQHRLVQLSNADTHRVRLMRNHGSSNEKPGCVVIEGHFETNGETRRVILLAAGYLLHHSFQEEVAPELRFVGDQVNHILHDRITTLQDRPINYGVAPENYFMVPSPDITPTSSTSSSTPGPESEDGQDFTRSE